MNLHSSIEWCVSRLVDNYEWQGSMDGDEWLELQEKITLAVIADKRLAQIVLSACEEHGIIEED
jgi:DNA-binding LacI/PurR family transcriptional regulator